MTAVEEHFNQLAAEYEAWKDRAWYYHGAVKDLLREFIPTGKRVLELGCGTGAILESLNPSEGIGIDASAGMIQEAKKLRPQFHFAVDRIETLSIPKPVDYIVMVDLVEHLPNLQIAFDGLARAIDEQTLIISTSANPLWAPILHLAEHLKMKMPEGPHRWPSLNELRDVAQRSGLVVRSVAHRMILPKKIPFISDVVNRWYPRSGPLAKLCLIQGVLFQKMGQRSQQKNQI